jgi:polycystin 1L2
LHRSLGELRLLRLWHDNSGKGAFKGWYCNRVIVIDHQTGIQYPFIVNKWMSVDEDDGVVRSRAPVSV